MTLRAAITVALLVGVAVAQTSFTTPFTNIPAPSFPTTRALGFKVRFTQNRQTGDTLSHPTLPGGWIGGYDGTDNVLYYSLPQGGDIISNIVNYVKQVRFTYLTATAAIQRSFQWEILGFCTSFSSSYQFYGSSVNYYTAVNNCASVYHATGFSYLVGISTNTENTLVRLLVNTAGGDSFWINNNDEQVEGVWRMRTGPEGLENSGQGRLTSYFNWNGGEPNNSGNEDCTHVYNTATWNDLPCSYVGQPYVCERSTTSYLHSGTVSANSGGSVSNLYQRSSAGTCGGAPTPTYITWCCPQVTAVCNSIQAMCNSWNDDIAGFLSLCEGENEYCTIYAAAVTAQQSCQRLYNDCHARNIQC